MHTKRVTVAGMAIAWGLWTLSAAALASGPAPVIASPGDPAPAIAARWRHFGPSDDRNAPLDPHDRFSPHDRLSPLDDLSPLDRLNPHNLLSPLDLLDPAGWALLDDFEDPRWPGPGVGLWRPPETGGGVVHWWPSTCRAHSGARSLWAFGGSGGLPRACDSTVPAGTRSTAIMNMDLRAATSETVRLDLMFDVWLGMPEGDNEGLFISLLLPQPDGTSRRVPVFGVTGTNRRWLYPARRLDLMNLVDINQPADVYDLRGGSWLFEWMAIAPTGTTPGGGIFVDDLYWVWEPDATVVAPTPRPTASISPGPTPTPAPTLTRLPAPTIAPSPTSRPPTVTPESTRSNTPRATAVPSQAATEAPVGGMRIWLPVVHNGELGDVTLPTGEATGEGTVQATATPAAVGTATAASTPTVVGKPTEAPDKARIWLPVVFDGDEVGVGSIDTNGSRVFVKFAGVGVKLPVLRGRFSDFGQTRTRSSTD